MNLAEVVIEARDIQPVAIRIHHAPAGEIVERGTPQHGLLAAGIHGDVTADAGGFGRCRIDRKYEACFFSGVGDALGDHTRTRVNRRIFAIETGQLQHFNRAEIFEFFGVDDRRHWRQRNRATGITGAAAARDDGEAELDAAFDQAGHLIFGVWRQHNKWVLDTPVGRIGHM